MAMSADLKPTMIRSTQLSLGKRATLYRLTRLSSRIQKKTQRKKKTYKGEMMMAYFMLSSSRSMSTNFNS